MSKGDQKTGIKEAQRKVLKQAAYERSKVEVVRPKAKSIGKLGSVKAKQTAGRGR